MNTRDIFTWILAGVLVTLVAGNSTRAASEEAGALAQEILDETGVKGGVVVLVGCGDGTLAASLYR